MKRIIGLCLIYLGSIVLIKGCVESSRGADFNAGWTLIPVVMVIAGLCLTKGDYLP